MSAQQSSKTDAVRPIFLGPRNCEAATGHSWRWCRDFARANGVEILRANGSKPFIHADRFVAALEAHADAEVTRTEPDERDELAALRQRLGKRRTLSLGSHGGISPESTPARAPSPRALPREAAR